MPAFSLSGVFPPLITPFRENGDVDFDACARNMDRWNGNDLGGYLVLGSNSEAAYLSEEEKTNLIRQTVQCAVHGRTVLAGTGLESSRETIRFTNHAAALGVHAVLVLTPCYYGAQMTDTALIHHFTSVADCSAVPVLLYNVPRFTHVTISPAVVRELSAHPNIIGMKDSSGSAQQLSMYVGAGGEGFRVMAGTAVVWYEALEMGIDGGIFAIANCLSRYCTEVQREFRAGNREKARRLAQRLHPVNAALTVTYGIAGLKFACELLGYDGGWVRSPLQPLLPEAKEEIRRLVGEFTS